MNNDFGSILVRLKAPLGERFSTMEGTFAGDILQAVASELARIWSQEMDVLTDRAFVSTAAGEWLDFACLDFGVERKEGESDETLRRRTLDRIREQAAGGNAADYRKWAMETRAVKAAQAFGLLRGPGTVDVFVIPEDGTDSPSAIAAANAAIQEQRPVCADVRVHPARQVTLSVSAAVTLEAGVALTAVIACFSAAMTRWLEDAALTARGSVISPGRISGLLLSCAGVLDVRGIRLNCTEENISLRPGEYAVCGSINLTGMVNAT